MKKKIKSFIKEHKIEIAMGTLLVAGGLGYILFRNRESKSVVNACNMTLPSSTLDGKSKDVIISQMIDSAKENIQNTIDKKISQKVDVSAHVRNLPKGHTHTLKNELIAKSAGIKYLPINKSYIPPYTRPAQS